MNAAKLKIESLSVRNTNCESALSHARDLSCQLVKLSARDKIPFLWIKTKTLLGKWPFHPEPMLSLLLFQEFPGNLLICQEI